jgi:hypothetical protein
VTKIGKKRLGNLLENAGDLKAKKTEKLKSICKTSKAKKSWVIFREAKSLKQHSKSVKHAKDLVFTFYSDYVFRST